MKLNNKRLGQVLAASLATAAVAENTANATTNECQKINGYYNAYTCDMTGIGNPIMYFTNSRVKTAILEEYCGGPTGILGGYTEEPRDKQPQATAFCNVELDQTALEDGLSVTDEILDTTPPELQSVSPAIGEELPEGTTSRLLIVGFDDQLTSASLQSLEGGTADTVNIIDGNTVEVVIENLQNGTDVTWSLLVTSEGGGSTVNGNFRVAKTPDTTPPKITVDPADGTVFPAGTTEVPITVTTDEDADCDINGIPTTSSEDGRTHTGEVTGLETGNNTYNRACEDPSGNRTEATGNLTVAEPIDTVPPTLSGFQPANGEEVPFVGQTEQTFSLTTDKSAECNRNGEPMNADTSGLYHSIQIPVEAGGTYPNEVICANANGYESDPVTVTFSVQEQAQEWMRHIDTSFSPSGKGSTKEFCIKGTPQDIILTADAVKYGACTSKYEVSIDGKVIGNFELPFTTALEEITKNTLRITRKIIECPQEKDRRGRTKTIRPMNETIGLEFAGDNDAPTITEGACPKDSKKKVRR